MLYCNIGSQAGVRILFALVGYQFRYSLIERRACVHCTALLFDTFTYIYIYTCIAHFSVSTVANISYGTSLHCSLYLLDWTEH